METASSGRLTKCGIAYIHTACRWHGLGSSRDTSWSWIVASGTLAVEWLQKDF